MDKKTRNEFLYQRLNEMPRPTKVARHNFRNTFGVSEDDFFDAVRVVSREYENAKKRNASEPDERRRSEKNTAVQLAAIKQAVIYSGATGKQWGNLYRALCGTCGTDRWMKAYYAWLQQDLPFEAVSR